MKKLIKWVLTMKSKIKKIYACDFETTVYDEQTTTEVWSSAICPVRSQSEINGKKPKPRASQSDVIVHHSIDETYQWLLKNQESCILYYHNLKFDGAFWLDFLLKHGWHYAKKVAYDEQFSPYTLETCISDLGQWYFIKLHFDGFEVDIKDSLKLMPMSLRVLGKSFKTEHQKLEMKYSGKRYAGCYISPSEMAYIKNDVLVLMECLEEMFSEGHDRLTIGSCCMEEFKRSIPKMAYEDYFVNLTKIPLNGEEWNGDENADMFIRKSYKGGWCYCKPDRAGTVYKYGCTADVNSLYPSMMHSDSGNRYPVGAPHFFKGNVSQGIAEDERKFWFIRINCAFKLKPGYLPFIQLKGHPFSLYYKGTEMLTDSRPTIKGKKYNSFKDDRLGVTITDHVTLTLTMMDYRLMHEHYNIYDEKIIGGCWFDTTVGLFDNYINKYRKIKMESKGAKRTIAKLFLNNLYGKLSSSTNSSYKRPELDSAGTLKLVEVEEYEKSPWFIAMGSAVTSYARNFTITAAQKNYKYFCYADTDSIHCTCKPEQLTGVPVHPTAFCHWKIESTWDRGYFVRQKTYIEHVIEEDQQTIEQPYYNVKCAGLPAECKSMFIESMTETDEQADHYKKMARVCEIIAKSPYCQMEHSDYLRYKFLSVRRDITDFKSGLVIPNKLLPKRVPGGIVLQNVLFSLK